MPVYAQPVSSEAVVFDDRHTQVWQLEQERCETRVFVQIMQLGDASLHDEGSDWTVGRRTSENCSQGDSEVRKVVIVHTGRPSHGFDVRVGFIPQSEDLVLLGRDINHRMEL